jgi:hypothetical protein
MLISSALIPLVHETSQRYPWWDANGQKALLCESKKDSPTKPSWCRFVKHAPPQTKPVEDEKKNTPPPAESPALQALLVSLTAVVMLLLGWLCYNRSQQQQQPPPAAAPKSERRGTVLSPTRRNSTEDRQSTAAADEDRPAAELGQAAAHLADAALADAARANNAAAQQPDQPGQLLAADLHADRPDSSSTGGLQALGRAELEPNGQGDGSSAPHLEADAADGASPLDTFMGHSAQHSSGLPGGVTGDGVATSASLAPVAAATARMLLYSPSKLVPSPLPALRYPLKTLRPAATAAAALRAISQPMALH